MTRDLWLSTHSYLENVASFCTQVEAAAAETKTTSSSIPRWDDYRGEFFAGVPLLRSINAGIDLEPAERMVKLLVRRLVSTALPDKLAEDTRILDIELRELDEVHRVVDWLLNGDVFSPRCPGLLRYLGWTAMARCLRPVVEAFNNWREEDRWFRNYCPTCGSPPAMAQLVGFDQGRRRLLSCGCCGTRWQFRRTECPFCENEDDRRLLIVRVEGENGLRIDHCESCGGYLKTYDGEGNEVVMLADWTSLHLDVIARDHGLKRLAASLYEL
jgi:FdhE protein